MELYLALAIPILLATAWLYTAQLTRSTLPALRGKRICLLIAHPDDEAMFFSPTVLALTAPEAGNHVKILCLSSGNADNLGPTRKHELLASAALLGLRSPSSDVLVIEDPLFPDSMTTTWPAPSIAQLLANAFSPSSSSQKEPKEPTATIDTLITFDASGISAHPNHISLYLGAKHWLKALMARHDGYKCPVELYSLTSIPLFRKYIGVLDAPITMLIAPLRDAIRARGRRRRETLLYVSSFGEWRRGVGAMVRGHRSQMRWFRWGWVGVGRYMVINDLRRVDVG
ncbi:N-acetylglucosaminyl-phosphatidylinositol de-N-acetylase [Puttea exsequens]|nr:N-acetylglucosaminyl-phosphatidylinositol de-N-acetylase [Puttea exsequens]